MVMKNLFLIFGTLVALTSTSYASTLTCSEIETNSPEKIEVVVNNLVDLTEIVSFGRAFDEVWKVKVQVYSVVGTNKSLIKEFEAISKAIDVQYFISSVKKNGFSFWRYMDEKNQDGVELTSANGQKQSHRLNCKN